MNSSRYFDILLAEDDPDDQFLMQQAINRSGTKCNLHLVDNGQALLDKLSQVESDLPDLILLDLNMPIKDGREALREIRQNPKIQNIPIVALTTSSAQEDLDMCNELGVNSYITKPAAFDELVEALKVLIAHWENAVKLPPEKL